MTRRRLLNLVTRLSLLLALASAVMWARSQFVDEAWESQPRTQWSPTQTWPRIGVRYRWARSRYYAIGSSNGRFTLAMNEFAVAINEAPSGPGLPTTATRFAPWFAPGRGFMQPAPMLLFDKSAYSLRGTSGGFPGVEWASRARDDQNRDGEHWFFSVSWLLFVGAFAILPAIRARRGARPSRGPAFPVVASGADKRTGVPAVSVSQTSPSPSTPA